ncbi:MAG: DUF4838 domain-containing protein [Ruminococcaceae bacterium]|nr:DUF4838 domain-containing protein [Oscillospiraceae bacterium]
MYRIFKINSSPVVDFAAEELKKYLRMMMPRCGEIPIKRDSSAKEGFLLGLMSDLSLDTSDAEDLTLDDIVYIDTTKEGGIIAGSNPRSVLLAVYKYLTLMGCRWLFPGIDGEQIPIKDLEPVKYRKLADCRYRGQCNEGAEFQPNMMEVIDFTPKLGMNVFMMEFDNPRAYYKHYYAHLGNEAREPEPVTDETVLQWKRQCEAEIARRGLQFHDVGHGWCCESFGIGIWEKGDDIPEESRQYLAEIKGKRGLFGGRAINTNFCMSNPEARRKVVDHIAAYADTERNVDYLHVWLADSCNNHCECERCAEKSPSDWYVVLLNELDAELTSRKLDTRIVFCCYVDTTWPPVAERINNPERFLILLGAISRKYTESVKADIGTPTLKDYERNNITLPETVEEYIAYDGLWKKTCHVGSFVYEYHFWINQFYALGGISYARIIHEDVKGYAANKLRGIIQDGSQRSFFPNGLAFYAYAQTLFDTSVGFEELKEDYLSHAYGEDWKEVENLLLRIEDAFDHKYLAGERSADQRIGKYYNPAMAEKLRKIYGIAEDFAPFYESHKNMPQRSQTVAMRLLRRYIEFCRGIAYPLTLKCFGAGKEAREVYLKFLREFGENEREIETCYDQHMFAAAYNLRIFNIGEAEFFGV